MTEVAQQRPHQRRLPRAKVAFEVNDQSRRQSPRQRFAQDNGRRLVGKSEFGVTIDSMQDIRHDQFSPRDYSAWPERIRALAGECGFAAIGIARAEIDNATAGRLNDWLASGRHGEMDYMARHAHLRAAPDALVPGTLSVISAALDYLPALPESTPRPDRAEISRYALGRDYHKVMRQRLQKLAERLAGEFQPFGYRVFSDSAPVLEVEFAARAGLGWRGKHTLLLSRQGSWRFLGEIYTDLPLPPDPPQEEHCGSCQACLTACPTGAIIAPYQVDARRCISYLSIEFAGSIPENLRPAIGQRIYGCDDCQLCCPWNRFARLGDPEFAPRHGLDRATLGELFAWSESDFLERLAGSPIRRIGHQRWLRNIAIALGNSPAPESVMHLQRHADHPDALIREHVAWGLAEQRRRAGKAD